MLGPSHAGCCANSVAAMNYDAETLRADLLGGVPATSLQSLDALRRVPGDHFVDNLDDARHLASRLLDR